MISVFLSISLLLGSFPGSALPHLAHRIPTTSVEIGELIGLSQAKVPDPLANQGQSANLLLVGKPIEVVLSGDRGRHTVNLHRGEHCRIALEGADLILSIFRPDGALLLKSVPDEGTGKARQTSFVAPADGVYRVEISIDGEAKECRYRVGISEIRPATAADEKIARAELLFSLGQGQFWTGKKESYDLAFQSFSEALGIWRGLNDKPGELRALIALADTQNKLAAFPEALVNVQAALPISEQLGDRRRETLVWHRFGFAYSHLAQQEKALEAYEKALALDREIGDRALEADTLNSIGLANSRLSRFEKALEYYQQALPIRQAMGNIGGVAIALGNIGLAYNGLSQYEKSLDFYNRSLPLSRSVGDREQEARTLNNIGLAYIRLSEYDKAVRYLNESLPIRREVGDRFGEAISLSNLGLAYRNMSQYERAIEYYAQALPLLRAVGDRAAEAVTLSNMGVAYARLGQPEKALACFNESLPVSEATGNRAQQASTLNNLGLAYSDAREEEKALEAYRKALSIQHDIGDRMQEAGTIGNIGRSYTHLGQFDQAIAQFTESMSIARTVGDRAQQSWTLCDAGFAYTSLGKTDKATEAFTEAREIAHQINDRAAEARALEGLAFLYRSSARASDARSAMEESIKLAEAIRGDVSIDESRASFFATSRARFDFLISLLGDLNQKNPGPSLAAEAFEVSERARARGLLDLLAASKIQINEGVDPAMKEKRQVAYALVSRAQSNLIRANSRLNPDPKRISALQKELADADNNRQQIELSIRRANPAYADLNYPVPLESGSVQKLLPPGTVLLEYSLGRWGSYVFAVTHDELRMVPLGSAEKITEEVQRLRLGLTSPGRASMTNFLSGATELYRDLIAPVSDVLRGKQQVVIVPDGVLYQLPFEVLLRNNGPKLAAEGAGSLPYLIRDFSIAYAPSASVLGKLGSSPSLNGESKDSMDFIAFADPSYGNTDSVEKGDLAPVIRGTYGAGAPWTLKPLPASRSEVEQIASLFPKNRTSVLLGRDATEENVKTEGRLGRYRYIHFAVHGLIDESQPQFSSLIFTLPGAGESRPADDGLLQMHEIFNLKLRADLVTLSACETGLGKEVRGEGFIGLTRAFFYAGAPSLLVSLWKVDDRSTADLMTRFYRDLLTDKKGKGEALRRAKLELIRDGRFAHPYYWAPFVLTGKAD